MIFAHFTRSCQKSKWNIISFVQEKYVWNSDRYQPYSSRDKCANLCEPLWTFANIFEHSPTFVGLYKFSLNFMDLRQPFGLSLTFWSIQWRLLAFMGLSQLKAESCSNLCLSRSRFVSRHWTRFSTQPFDTPCKLRKSPWNLHLWKSPALPKISNVIYTKLATIGDFLLP